MLNFFIMSLKNYLTCTETKGKKTMGSKLMVLLDSFNVLNGNCKLLVMFRFIMGKMCLGRAAFCLLPPRVQICSAKNVFFSQAVGGVAKLSTF